MALLIILIFAFGVTTGYLLGKREIKPKTKQFVCDHQWEITMHNRHDSSKNSPKFRKCTICGQLETPLYDFASTFNGKYNITTRGKDPDLRSKI